MKVIIAAAGTGGHINPGIAIANQIKEKYKNAEIIFIGTPTGIENDLVPRAGYKLKTLDAYGLQRKISIQNFKRICKTLKSYGEAKKIVKKFKPNLVIGTGGYICGPVILAAIKYKAKTMLHESNAFPGVAVKLLSNKVDTIMVGFEDAKKRLPKARNVVVTGTPTKIRKKEVTDNQKNDIKKELGINNNLPIILAFGGSQGAESINNSLIQIINNKLNYNYQIIWAIGKKQYEVTQQKVKGLNNCIILPYIYNMEEVLNIADVVVSRSGALTITEVAKCHKPAIFIPFPYATENHQMYNAQVLEKVGAAQIILDSNLNKDILNDTIQGIIKDKNKMRKMSENAKKVETKNVEENIYKEIEKLVNK